MNSALKLMQRPDALRLTEKADQAARAATSATTAFDHYPAAAKRDAIDGLVVVDMLLNAEGQVLEAEVAAESPPGFGFGLAATGYGQDLRIPQYLQAARAAHLAVRVCALIT